MSEKRTPPLPFDPSTVDLDALLKRLNLANTRRMWRTLVERAESDGWSCRDFLKVSVSEEVSHSTSLFRPRCSDSSWAATLGRSSSLKTATSSSSVKAAEERPIS